ncbi:MAG: c-type cytochrome [Sphingomonadales bacterium]
MRLFALSMLICLSGVLHISSAIAADPSDDPTATPYSSAGDVAAGEQLFKRCKACHLVTDEGRARPTGPRLYGLFGRTAGSLAEFKYYSKALKKADHVWTEERLYAFLEDPNAYVPGIKSAMRVQKITDQDKRKDLLAYLRQATALKNE